MTVRCSSCRVRSDDHAKVRRSSKLTEDQILQKAKDLCRSEGKAWSVDDLKNQVPGVSMVTVVGERGLDVSYETVRRWVLKFGPLFAKELRRRRPRPTSRWHLDEMAVLIGGRRFWLWRAVDDEVSIFSCSGGATPERLRNSCADCSRSRALRLTYW
jgi:hypothetical protein